VQAWFEMLCDHGSPLWYEKGTFYRCLPDSGFFVNAGTGQRPDPVVVVSNSDGLTGRMHLPKRKLPWYRFPLMMPAFGNEKQRCFHGPQPVRSFTH
jgi:hypothetical protein